MDDELRERLEGIFIEDAIEEIEKQLPTSSMPDEFEIVVQVSRNSRDVEYDVEILK